MDYKKTKYKIIFYLYKTNIISQEKREQLLVMVEVIKTIILSIDAKVKVAFIAEKNR